MLAFIAHTYDGYRESKINSPGIVINEIITDLTGNVAPFRCYANVKQSSPLYEKVLCQLQLLVLDNNNRPGSVEVLSKIR